MSGISTVNFPEQVTIFEMAPRDGLQNEAAKITVADKVTLIEGLTNAGVKKIEAGSFVSPKWVPQMANSDDVLKQVSRIEGVAYTALTPNMRGYEGAIASGADEVAVFGAASEGFTQKNINCSIAESIERFIPVIEAAKAQNLPVRGYVSCVAGCPYDGDIAPEKVAEVAKKLFELGCYEISLGDTIGVGTPQVIQRMLNAVQEHVPANKLAVHFHDTYGQALTNILVALQNGISVIDSSVAGLGGCPYAKGASGNVASEDVIYMLHGMGIETGIDLNQMVQVGASISKVIGKAPQSKVALALLAKETAKKTAK